MSRALLAVCALCAGCTETVGFLSLELVAPDWVPELVCSGDPRRAREIVLSLDCEDEKREGRYDVEMGTVSLGDAPLGPCEIRVKAINAYGRAVASGSALTTIERGENPLLEIPLVEEPCDSSCDRDGDDLANDDEEALQLDPDRPDSDRDGLPDGFELQECCTDPTRPGAECKLLIQAVLPLLGKERAPVVVTSTTALDNPRVELGGKPLDVGLVDTKTIIGQVAQGAVLGEVKLTSAGSSDSFQALFAVLRDDPEFLFEIEQKAGASSGLMPELTDLVQGDKGVLFLLGPGRSNDMSNNTTRATIVAIDRLAGRYRRLTTPRGSPVALALEGELFGVLVQDDTSTRFYGYPTSGLLQATGGTAPTYDILLDSGRSPVSLLIEPGQRAIQVLYADGLTRVGINSPTERWTIDLRSRTEDTGTPNHDPSQVGVTGCTGFTYHPSSRYSYAACNIAGFCRAGEPCLARGTLVRIGPVGQCDVNSTSGRTGNACLSTFLAGGPDAVVGSPVVDEAQRRAYVLTTRGLFAAPLAQSDGTVPLEPWVLFKWQGQPHHRLMAASAATGALFVLDGEVVRRLKPRAQPMAARLGKPFVVGTQGEQGRIIAGPRDGSALDIARQQAATSLLTVCLSRAGPLCP